MDYNGWANYDTWLVVVWLDNDLQNYEKWQKMSQEDIVGLSPHELKHTFYYGGDEVNFDNVDMSQIIENLLQDKQE